MLCESSIVVQVSEFKGGLTVGEAIAAAGDKYDEAHALTWIAEVGAMYCHESHLLQPCECWLCYFDLWLPCE